MSRPFYMLRHGETDWNAEGRLQGQTDIPLNECGRTQARQVRAFLAGLDISMCYASPLRRAYETAEIALAGHTALETLTPHAALQERNFGRMNGMIHSDAEQDKRDNPHHYIDVNGKGRLFPLDGEPNDAFIARTTLAYRDLPLQHDGSVLLVTHGGVMRQIFRMTIGPDDDTHSPNCGLWHMLPAKDGLWERRLISQAA